MKNKPIGFFTNGVTYHLPHPPIPKPILCIVHNAVAHALQLLKNDPPRNFQLATALEDDLTRQLQEVLENRLRQTGEVSGFDSRMFGRVEREPKVSNFNGSHPDKMPDLRFNLAQERHATLSSFDALFAECKPVGASHTCGQHYCDRGMQRFIDGEYAWAMQEGLMIAYVRDGRSIKENLAPAMAKREGLACVSTITPVLPTSQTTTKEALHVSDHSRGFVWQNNQRAVGIKVFHSWHDCQ